MRASLNATLHSVESGWWQAGPVTHPAPGQPDQPDQSLALRDPAHQVSTRAPVVWAVGAALRSLVGLAVLVAAAVFGWFDVPVWAWPAYVALAAAYTIAMPRVRYRIHRWESTDTAVYTQTGWLSRERRIAPMSRVQTVDFEQGPIDRLLDLASVTVTTASAAGPLRISAIDKVVADRLVEDLTRRTESDPGDAT
jgi:membrane protein YdbS with pleckstrin-like domain